MTGFAVGSANVSATFMLTRMGWFLLIMSVSATACGQTAGTITGVVLNERGAPVAQAQVLASKMGVQRAGSSVLQYHEADAEGGFTIENLSWGIYRVSAKKEDEGYPDPGFGLCTEHDESIPVVTLKAASPTASVSIHLRPKAGAIQSISVVDAVTGMEMNSAAITLRRAAEPAIFVETSTTLRPILVPSNTDVSVEITATGYKGWPGNHEPKKKSQIRLSPEQGVKLEVKLAPDNSMVNSVALFSPASYAPARNITRPGPKPSNPILSKAVKPFSVTADDISFPLKKLANEYQVPIGFESSHSPHGKEETKSVQIDLEAGTVRDVLDAIVAADPAYAWEETSSVVENVFPKDHADSLLDVVVGEYSVENVYRDQAIDALTKAPEIQRWMAEKGIHRQELDNTTPSPSNPSEIFYHIRFKGATVRNILNTILTGTQAHFWQYSQFGDHNQYFSITMTE